MCKGFMQRINSSKDGIQMAKKQMKKKCSTLVTWEMQIKTIMRYHFTLLGWLGFFLLKQKTSSGNYIKKLKPLYITDGNVKWCSHCGKQLVSSSKT